MAEFKWSGDTSALTAGTLVSGGGANRILFESAAQTLTTSAALTYTPGVLTIGLNAFGLSLTGLINNGLLGNSSATNVGGGAGLNNQGNNCTNVGVSAGGFTSLTTSNNNTNIGTGAGEGDTGGNNITVGYQAHPTPGGSNQLTLGSFVTTHATDGSLQVPGIRNFRVSGSLGVGNSAAATILGLVTKRIEIFDFSGTSLGFIAVYDSIT
jgi:hypothetical protein